jgi:DNA-binding winged helix-turn-helix (wHTH) protein
VCVEKMRRRLYNGLMVKLSPSESRLYWFFMKHFDEALPHEAFSAIPPFEVLGNLRVCICKMRKKLMVIDPSLRIVTLPWYGYRLEKVSEAVAEREYA